MQESGCTCANRRRVQFLTIYTYYTTSNRRNQLFFATFHSKIANLCNSHQPSVESASILFIPHNSLFFDGLPVETSGFYPVISILFPSAHQRQMSCWGRFTRLRPVGIGMAVRCVCNKAPPFLHFAGFPQPSFIIFATNSTKAEPCPALVAFTGFSAGILSAPQSRPGADPTGPCPPGR